jgi:hypothetical protein
VDDLDQLLDAVRAQARAVVARAHEAMEAGAPIARVMDRYVTCAFDLEAEADTQAILASAGDSLAEGAVRDCLEELEDLREDLDTEFPDQR